MAAGPTSLPAVSSDRTYSATPRRVRMYIKSGVMLGGQKVDCCEGSFERCYLLTQAIALSERRSLTRKINSPLEKLFLSREFWARLIFWYESTYRSGLLAYFSCSVPISWSQKASSQRQENPRKQGAPNMQYGGKICEDLWKSTPAEVHIAGLRWNQWGTSRSPPYCKPIPQNQ